MPDEPTAAAPAAPSFAQELEQLLNKHSQENASDTPDFILATYVLACLKAFADTTRHRDHWYGFQGLSRRTGQPVENPHVCNGRHR